MSTGPRNARSIQPLRGRRQTRRQITATRCRVMTSVAKKKGRTNTVKINPLLSGAALSCLTASLLGCAGKPLVRTETVEVDRPVVVALDARLTAPVDDAPIPARLTNDGLAGVAEGEKCRRIMANCQLEKIEALQPGEPRHAVKWCGRYAEVCKAGWK